MPQDTEYVYIARFFDSPQSIAINFGIKVEELYAVNPQWKNRVLIFFTNGDEVILPESVEKSPMFYLNRFLYNIKERKKEAPKPKVYPPNWFPPKPSFGSPSKPLETLLQKLGNPKYTVDKPGTYHSPITFKDNWDKLNISTVSIPQLNGVPFYSLDGKIKCKGKISFYTKAHKAVQELFNAWEKDGLIGKILTFEGSFNPRVIKKSLVASNHSFGTAFDINGPWNKEGFAPAGIGKQGCLLELVPRAGELGFYWGGFYKDGMHFEYAKL